MKDLIANMKITTLFVWSFIALIVMAIQVTYYSPV